MPRSNMVNILILLNQTAVAIVEAVDDIPGFLGFSGLNGSEVGAYSAIYPDQLQLNGLNPWECWIKSSLKVRRSGLS